MRSVDIAKTYIKHGDLWFFVSTINRESSAAVSFPPWYAETIVWSTTLAGERLELLWTGDAHRDSIQTLQKAVEALRAKGLDGLTELTDSGHSALCH